MKQTIKAEEQQQRYHHGNLRSELLRAAHRHLRDGGIDKLSLRALAREIGVSQTAPYRHFTDKKELLAALACDGFRRLFSSAETGIEWRGEDPADALMSLSRHYIRFACDNGELYQLMFGPLLRPRQQYPELFAAGRAAYANVQVLVQQGIEQKVFRSRDADYLSRAVWAMLHGLASLLRDQRNDAAYNNDANHQLEAGLCIMLEGLKTR